MFETQSSFSVIRIIESSASTFLPNQNYMPLPVKGLFRILEKTHKIWRLFQKKEIYFEPNNFTALISGHLVSWTVGNHKAIKIVAQSILIVYRILDVSDKIIKTKQSAKKLVYTCLNFPSLYEGNWQKQGKYSSYFYETTAKIKLIALQFFYLMKCCFQLTMSIIEAYQAFYLNPNTEQENVREMFVNAFKSIDYLSLHQTELESHLMQYKAVLQQIFRGLGSNYEVDQMLPVVRGIVKATQAVKSSNDKVNDRLKGFFQHAAVGFLDSLGLAKMVPKQMIPLNSAPNPVPYTID